MSRVLRLDLEYDGTAFHGWARQPGLRTVQGVLDEALGRLLGHEPETRVAGRTDAGVHATGQVVSLRTSSGMPAERVLRALPALLPRDAACRAAADAPPGFDARRDALSRTYEYRVLTGPPSPLRRGVTLHHPAPIEPAALRKCAAGVVGRHDFRAFTPTQTEHVFFHRTVLRCDWEARDDELVLAIEADAFLRGMVRTLVGSMLEVGRGAWPVERFTALLDGAPRDRAGPTAPAHGLALTGVTYPAGRPSRGGSGTRPLGSPHDR
jgi:tRNA pseudouridine38-40 synthase